MAAEWWLRCPKLPTFGECIAGAFVASVKGVAPLSFLLVLGLVLRLPLAHSTPFPLQVRYTDNAREDFFLQSLSARASP